MSAFLARDVLEDVPCSCGPFLTESCNRCAAIEDLDVAQSKLATLTARCAELEGALHKADSALDCADDELASTFSVPPFLVCRIAIKNARDGISAALTTHPARGEDGGA